MIVQFEIPMNLWLNVSSHAWRVAWARGHLTATRSLRRQRNELDLITRHFAKMAGCPFGLGLLNAFLAG